MGAESEIPQRVAVSRDGEAILVGTYQGSADFGGGPLLSAPPLQDNAFIAKYAPDGTLLWSRGFGSTVTEGAFTRFTAVAVDRRGRISVAGEVEAGVDLGSGPLPFGAFVAQFSPDGRLRWVRPLLGGQFNFRPSLATDRAGNVLLVGSIVGPVDFGGGTPRFASDAAFIAKYDADGRYLWDRVFRSNSLFADVVVGSREELYVSGFFEEPGSDFGGGPLRPTGLLVAAPVVASFNAEGTHRWSRTLEGSADGNFRGLAVHGNRVVVAGGVDGPFRFDGAAQTLSGGILAAYTRDGEERWVRRVGSQATSVAMDPRDGVTVIGLYRGGTDLGAGPLPGSPTSLENGFVARFDRLDGDPLWARGFPDVGPANFEFVTDVEVAREGDVLMTGLFSVPIDFGTGTLTPATFRPDTYLLRLCP
jgi:outer membrane protein assembly factor BamB